MSITGANAIYTIAIPGLFPIPQLLQGFAADDVFDTDTLESVETLMGVDGNLSAGFVFVPVKQGISIQADSISGAIFDQWYAAQQAIQDTYSAIGVIIQPTLGLKFALSNGYLTSYKPVADTKKLIQPRKFGITWNSISPASI